MGSAREWSQIPDAVGVYWEGLELQSVEALTPAEHDDIVSSARRQEFKFSGCLLGCFGILALTLPA